MNSCRNFLQMLEKRAELHPSRNALLDDRRALSYGGLYREVCALAGKLAETGVRPGDTVILFGGNSADWLAAFFGLLSAGAECILMNYGMQDSFIRDIIRTDKVSRIFFGDCPPGSGDIRRIAEEEGIPEDRTEDYHRLVRETASGERDGVPSALPEDPPFMVLTSGSTYTPKKALMTQASQLYAVQAFERTAGSREGRTVIIGHPLFHMLGLQTCLYYLYGGGTACLPLIHGAQETADWIAAQGPADLSGMAGYYAALADSPLFDEKIASYAGQCIFAGVFSPKIRMARLESRFDHAVFVSMYGQTECAPIAIQSPSMDLGTRTHAAGLIPEGTSVRILDDRDRPVKDGEIGRIAVRSPAMMQGYRNLYYHDKGEFFPFLLPVDEDGYLPTGDIGWMDAEGRLFVEGRVRSEINRKSVRTYPGEIERELEKDPNIRETLIMGLQHPVFGETAVAAVTVYDAEGFSERKTLSALRKALGRDKAPDYVFRVDAIPFLPSGKPDRPAMEAEIRRMYMERMIAEKTRTGIPVLTLTLKATVHALETVEALAKALAGRLGFEDGRARTIASLARRIMMLLVRNSPGTLNDLRMEARLFQDCLTLSFSGVYNRFTINRSGSIRKDAAEILDQADDFRFDLSGKGPETLSLDFVYDDAAAAADYLNLETGQVIRK